MRVEDESSVGGGVGEYVWHENQREAIAGEINTV